VIQPGHLEVHPHQHIETLRGTCKDTEHAGAGAAGSVRSDGIDRISRRAGRALSVLAVAAVTVAACIEPEERTTDTLVPLPTVGTTTTVPATTTTVPAVATTTPVTVGPTTTLADQPVGDWDGARFDFGRIVDDGETDDDLYRTIELDRYSYRSPTLGLVDAAGFIDEPITYWWLEDPYENNNPNTREFVLAPNVELLALSEEGEEIACAEPPPAQLPPPVWQGVDISFLDTGAARRSLVSITYAANGAVSRIRFTHGCDD
jgi:hypothetical protein